jgi:hypothetical protein
MKRNLSSLFKILSAFALFVLLLWGCKKGNPLDPTTPPIDKPDVEKTSGETGVLVREKRKEFPSTSS